MTDFPREPVLPLFINSFCQYGPIGTTRALALNAAAALGVMDWGGANTAAYIPFYLPWSYPVNRVFWANGSTTASSNTDFGIYTQDGARIYSTASTAVSGASVLQFVTPSPTFVLAPGSYYMAYVNNGTTTRAYGQTIITAALGRAYGLQQQASALPLPAAATFASWAIIGLPLCGFTLTTTGF